MEILSNQDGRVIIQAEVNDFRLLLGEGSTYSKVAIIRSDVMLKSEIKDLLPGDRIDTEVLESKYVEAHNIIGEMGLLKKSCAGIKSQSTRLMNLLNGASLSK